MDQNRLWLVADEDRLIKSSKFVVDGIQKLKMSKQTICTKIMITSDLFFQKEILIQFK